MALKRKNLLSSPEYAEETHKDFAGMTEDLERVSDLLIKGSGPMERYTVWIGIVIAALATAILAFVLVYSYGKEPMYVWIAALVSVCITTVLTVIDIIFEIRIQTRPGLFRERLKTLRLETSQIDIGKIKKTYNYSGKGNPDIPLVQGAPMRGRITELIADINRFQSQNLSAWNLIRTIISAITVFIIGANSSFVTFDLIDTLFGAWGLQGFIYGVANVLNIIAAIITPAAGLICGGLFWYYYNEDTLNYSTDPILSSAFCFPPIIYAVLVAALAIVCALLPIAVLAFPFLMPRICGWYDCCVYDCCVCVEWCSWCEWIDDSCDCCY